MRGFERLAGLLRRDWPGGLLLAEGLTAIAFASAAIKLLPFRWVMKLASRPCRRSLVGEDAALEIARCRSVIRAWSRVIPWRAVCFQQGLALHLMLRRRGVPSVLHYGIAKAAEGALTAHVWISAEGRIVLGVEAAIHHALVASFPAGEVRMPGASLG